MIFQKVAWQQPLPKCVLGQALEQKSILPKSHHAHALTLFSFRKPLELFWLRLKIQRLQRNFLTGFRIISLVKQLPKKKSVSLVIEEFCVLSRCKNSKRLG